MHGKTAVILLIVGYILLGKGGMSGCQMPESALVKQSGFAPVKQSNLFGPETSYTQQRAEDAQRQRANSAARNAFWNNFWHQENVDNLNQKKAERDQQKAERNQFRKQQLDAEYKARQMLIDKGLLDFQQKLDKY